MEARIRNITAADAPALAELWRLVFRDPAELPAGFLRLLPEMGGGVAAEKDGRIVGAAYILTGLHAGGRRAAYLYAVAVHPAYRGLGLGKGVTRAAAALGKELGADFVCTLPATPPLYGWYKELIGVECALYRKKESFPARPGPAVRELEAKEYNARREALLAPLPHLTLSAPVMAYEQLNCRCFGGGLFAVGDGIAAVYREKELAHVWELLCPDPAQRPVLAAAAAAAVGTERAVLYSPASEADGAPYLTAEPGFLPSDCVWDLTLE